jgi:hypothetical protein
MARRSLQERLPQLEAARKALTIRSNKQERAQAGLRKVFVGAFLLHRLGNPGEPTSSMRLFDWLRTALPCLPSGEIGHALFDVVLNSAAKYANNDLEVA